MVWPVINNKVKKLLRLDTTIQNILDELSVLSYASELSFLKQLIKLNESREIIASIITQIELNEGVEK